MIGQLEEAINSVEIANNQPQSVGLGFFHEFDNQWQLTVDALWIEFSEFGATEISIVNQEVTVPESIFQNFWVYSAGLQLPLTPNVNGRVGMLYMEQPVKDEDRTFSFALDRIFGVGAGISYQLPDGNRYDLNLNLLDTGSSPIDTGNDPVRGRVVGEVDNHYALSIDFAYHWR